MPKMSTAMKQGIGGSAAIVVGLVVIGLGLFAFPMELPLRLWAAGAGALGLVSGFTTGLSSQPGASSEFVKFIGAGILVPLVGGVATLLARPQQVTETSTYSDTQLTEKITTTVTLVQGSLDPLTVLGLFFIVFGFLAILGILGGALLRKAGFPALFAA